MLSRISLWLLERFITLVKSGPGANRFFWRVVIVATVVGRWLTRYRLYVGHPRTLWGITPIITLRLKAQCDRALGFESESVVFDSYYITNKFDINFKHTVEWLRSRNAKDDFDIKYDYFCRTVLAWALLRYDFFSYFHDRGILPPSGQLGIQSVELEALHKAGKRLFVYAYGADVRVRSTTLTFGKWNCCVECPEPGTFCICEEPVARANTDRIARYANAVVTMGDFHEYTAPSNKLDYWPIDTESIQYVGVNRRTGPLVVGHAPNHPLFKGTEYLRSAVTRLRNEGVDIELKTLSGVPNEKVLELFAQADVIADQFMIGSHGYTTLESMARGKPVLCYIRERDMMLRPDECPVINTNPDTIYATLKWCAANREELARLGMQGRRYVELHHSIRAVGARLGRLYLEAACLPPTLWSKVSAAVTKLDKELDSSRHSTLT